MSFADDQFSAASSFAYTMIVVDDEPRDQSDDPELVGGVKVPGRRDVTVDSKVDQTSEAKRSHPLDSQSLIKSALDLARLCTKNARDQVQKIPFVAIYTKACSMGKMFPPKSPTSCHRSR